MYIKLNNIRQLTVHAFFPLLQFLVFPIFFSYKRCNINLTLYNLRPGFLQEGKITVSKIKFLHA